MCDVGMVFFAEYICLQYYYSSKMNLFRMFSGMNPYIKT